MKFKLVLLILLTSSAIGATDAMGQWVQTNGPTGPFATSVKSLGVIGTDLLAGTDGGGIYRSTDSGASWIVMNAGLTYVKAFATMENYLFAACAEVDWSTDSGMSWPDAGQGIPGITWALAVQDKELFAGTDSGVFHSIDSGYSWIPAGVSIPYVQSLAINGTNLFASTEGDGVFRSTNNGITWTRASSGLSRGVQTFAVLATDLFAGTYDFGVFRSTDSGRSWTGANSGIKDSNICAFETSGTNIFACGDGVFLSTDSGNSWKAMNEGLSDSGVYALAIIGGNLFAGTYGGGVWRRPLSEMIGSSSVANTPQPANTITIYPNPVSHEATIGFSTNAPSQTSVTIFDVLGNEIAELFNGTLEAGSHSLPWDASTVLSGTYYARISADNGNVQTMKIAKN